MLFHVNPNDGLPLYWQLVRQVRGAIASGQLRPGDKLPSQRDLAGELVINHLTVKKAYNILETQGVITTLRGRGTFVVTDPPDGLRDEGLERLRLRARELADTARLLGLHEEDYLHMLEQAWRRDEESRS